RSRSPTPTRGPLVSSPRRLRQPARGGDGQSCRRVDESRRGARWEVRPLVCLVAHGTKQYAMVTEGDALRSARRRRAGRARGGPLVRDTAAMENPTLHPDCAALAFLLGRWEGTGRGLWIADTPFRYREEVVIDHAGKPFLRYAQRTWAEDDGRPMHSEVGYLRPVARSRVELLLVQQTGVAEIHEGRIEGRALELEAVLVGVTPTAKRVTDV